MSLTAIRDQIATRIRTVSGYTTANVRQDKFPGDAVATLPFACIYHIATQREGLTVGPTRTFRNLSTITIEIHADKGSATNLQNNLDTQGAAITAAVDSDRTLNGNSFQADLISIEDEYSNEGDKPRGMRRLTYEIEWHQTITN
jgi:hypothetical protein